MREECKNYQSRTYPSGEVARFCRLDLAPEAPWKCPDDCPMYSPRMADVGWQHGSLVEPPIEERPEMIEGEDAAKVLDEAEDIINEVGHKVVEEFQKESTKRRRWRKKK